jgi:hypothetical protein
METLQPQALTFILLQVVVAALVKLVAEPAVVHLA